MFHNWKEDINTRSDVRDVARAEIGRLMAWWIDLFYLCVPLPAVSHPKPSPSQLLTLLRFHFTSETNIDRRNTRNNFPVDIIMCFNVYIFSGTCICVGSVDYLVTLFWYWKKKKKKAFFVSISLPLDTNDNILPGIAEFVWSFFLLTLCISSYQWEMVWQFLFVITSVCGKFGLSCLAWCM